MRDVAARFPQTAATVHRATKSNWNHTEVCSGPLVLTENSVQTPCAPVDKAEFRVTLAESSQLSLFEDAARPKDAPLYVLLLHSRSHHEELHARQKWGHLPGSAYAAFPCATLDYYVHEINLFDRYPDIVRSHMPQEWDTMAQVQYFARARKARFA